MVIQLEKAVNIISYDNVPNFQMGNRVLSNELDVKLLIDGLQLLTYVYVYTFSASAFFWFSDYPTFAKRIVHLLFSLLKSISFFFLL